MRQSSSGPAAAHARQPKGAASPNPHIDFPQFCVWLQIPKSRG
jgi:hypothetical protein